MNYRQEITVTASPETVFTAIAQYVEKWWGKTDLPVSQIGDEFTTSFDQTYWKFRITEFQPFEKITWKCIDARHVHEGYENIEREWVGTTLHWTIEPAGVKSKISFIHNGLTSELNCYDACKPAWDMFITQSLKSFVEAGKRDASFSVITHNVKYMVLWRFLKHKTFNFQRS